MILYTKTVCPKCMLAKLQLSNAGINYDVVNLDKHEDKREELKSKGFLTTPILENNGEYYITQSEIKEFIDSL